MNKVYNRRCYLRAFLIAFIMLVIVVCAAVRVYAEPAWFGKLADDYGGKVVIISTNDVRGQLDRYQYVAGLRDELINRHADKVIIVDAGNFLQGSSNVVWDQGLSAVRMMNAVGYNYVAAGNLEFGYGWEHLVNILHDNAQFRIIGANLVIDNGYNLYPSSISTHTDDWSLIVGFFGVTTPATRELMLPSQCAGMYFIDNDTEPDLIDTVAHDIEWQRTNGVENADIVIGLTHFGVDPDNAPYRSYDLWSDLSENAHGDHCKMPDLLLDGHSQSAMTEGTDGQPIMSTGAGLENVGITVIDKATKKIDDWFLYKVDDIKKAGYSNEAVEQEWLAIQAEMEAKLSKPAGETLVDLNGAEKKSDAKPKYPNGNRDGETNLGDLCADAFRYVADTEKAAGRTYDVDDDHIIGFVNGGGLYDHIKKGEIKLGDLFQVLPDYHKICGVYVKGRDLLEVMEAATQHLPKEDAAFPQVSGVDYSINAKPRYCPAAEPYPGTQIYGPSEIRRVTINSVNGKPFDEDDTYLVFTTDVCAESKGIYYKFSQSDKRFIANTTDIDALSYYIMRDLGGVIGEEYAEPKGRINIKTPVIEAKAVKATYNKKTPKIPAPVVTDIDGEIKYKYYSDKAGKKEIKAPVNAGTYYYKAYYEGDVSISPIESNIATITISRASAKIKAIKPAKKKVNKGKTFKLTVSKTSGSGKVTYKRVKGTKYITVSKSGKVKVGKKCRKCKTYTIKVRATAAQNTNYKSAKKTQSIKIKVS